MNLKHLFDNLKIKRIRVWTDGQKVYTFCAEDNLYHPLFVDGETQTILEREGMRFLRNNKILGLSIFDFEASRGVLYLDGDELRYCGDVIGCEGDFVPFHIEWADGFGIACAK
jgi:hypothetical protein